MVGSAPKVAAASQARMAAPTDEEFDRYSIVEHLMPPEDSLRRSEFLYPLDEQTLALYREALA